MYDEGATQRDSLIDRRRTTAATWQTGYDARDGQEVLILHEQHHHNDMETVKMAPGPAPKNKSKKTK